MITRRKPAGQAPLTKALRWLHPYQKGTITAPAAGSMATIIGDHALRWARTGYAKDTLWDWLQLLILPLTFPAILPPALPEWVRETRQ
jgi:hypothetical protein